jgi:hypothetical protein
MRILGAGLLSLIALAACNNQPSDADVLKTSCISNGEKEATCVSTLKANLEAEDFKKMAEAVGRNNQGVAAYIASLSKQEQEAYSSFWLQMSACAAGATQ